MINASTNTGLMNLMSVVISGVKGTQACVLQINRDNEELMKGSGSIPGITKLYSFRYKIDVEERSVLLRYSRHSDLGAGKEMRFTNVEDSCFDPIIKSAYSHTG